MWSLFSRDHSRKSKQQESSICASSWRMRRHTQCHGRSQWQSGKQINALVSDSDSRLAQPKGCEPASSSWPAKFHRGDLLPADNVVPSELKHCQEPEISSWRRKKKGENHSVHIEMLQFGYFQNEMFLASAWKRLSSCISVQKNWLYLL